MVEKKASEILKNTKITQLKGALACDKGEMCATGVLLYEMGYHLEDLVDQEQYPANIVNHADKWYDIHEELYAFWETIYNKYGMKKVDWYKIIEYNDNGMSFKEIAEMLEEKGF